MSETRGKNRVPVNLDVALREWPDTDKTTGDWDDRAKSVIDRLKRGERGASAPYVVDENLFDGPLGQSAEDGHNSASTEGSPQKREGTPMTMPADRERDRRSLQDLAKMAHGLTPPPASVMPNLPISGSGVVRAAEAQKDDSGIVDLAAASTADPSAALRAQSTPLASQGLFEDEPRSQAPQTAPFGSAQSLPAQPVPSMPPPMPASIAPQALTPSARELGAGMSASSSSSLHSMPAAQKKKSGGGAVIALVIGGVVALSAAAAGGVLFMKARKAATEAAAAAAAVATQPTIVAQADPTPAPSTPAPAADPTPAPEPANADAPKAAAKPAGKAGAPMMAAAPKAAAPTPAKAEGPAKMTEKDLAAAPSGPAGDLGAAMKKEVGDEGAKTPAAASTGANATVGNVPQKPSQGAVTGALGAVLPGARACLGPDDPISRASVVFTSGGTVQSVSVSGAAAGKPAEACIKGALMKAKVQPFAEPTYTANITVRHN